MTDEIIDIGIPVDLTVLRKSRMILQANSGGGKTFATKKILETSNGRIHQFIFDIEGEFAGLREKYDYVLAGGEDGDIKLDIRFADQLCHKFVENGIDLIIDLSEMKTPLDKVLYVQKFLEAMMDILDKRKSLRHPILIVVDEAHKFCPEGEKNFPSSEAILDVCSRGRKREVGIILLTQRIAKLSKSAVAECNNKLIGRCSADTDMKRASEELGFRSKDEMYELRKLHPGEFYAFGPAISQEVVKIKIAPLVTKHEDASGKVSHITPPPTDRVKEIIKEMVDLPKEFEQKLTTLEEYKSEVERLKSENRILRENGNQEPFPDTTSEINTEHFETVYRLNNEIETYKNALENFKVESERQFNELRNLSENQIAQQKDYAVQVINHYNQILMDYKTKLSEIGEALDNVKALGIELNLPAPEDINLPVFNVDVINALMKQGSDRVVPSLNNIPAAPPKENKPADVMQELHKAQIPIEPKQIGESELKLQKAHLAILRYLTTFHDKSYPRYKIALMCLYTTGGHFDNIFRELVRAGYVVENGNRYSIAENAINTVEKGNPSEYQIKHYFSKLEKCEKKIAEFLLTNFSKSYPRADVAKETGYNTGGHFDNCMRFVIKLQLAIKDGNTVKFNPELLRN